MKTKKSKKKSIKIKIGKMPLMEKKLKFKKHTKNTRRRKLF